MLDSGSPDLSFNKSRVTAHAIMSLRPLNTEIISIAFIDPGLTLLGQNYTFSCEFLEFPLNSPGRVDTKIMSLALIDPILAPNSS